LLNECAAEQLESDKQPHPGAKVRPEFDTRKTLANDARMDLMCINELGIDLVTKIFSEIGTRLCRFTNVKRFCSWLGLCPSTRISGGQAPSACTKCSADCARQAPCLAASHLSWGDTVLGAFYRRWHTHIDKRRANRTIAHKLARLVYVTLTRKEGFVAQGRQKPEEQPRQRSIVAVKIAARSSDSRQIPRKNPHGLHYHRFCFLIEDDAYGT